MSSSSVPEPWDTLFANYRAFGENRFQIVGIYDSDPALVGTPIGEMSCNGGAAVSNYLRAPRRHRHSCCAGASRAIGR